MEALNRHGMLYGSGRFRRQGDKIVSELPVKSFCQERDACATALVGAFTRKEKYTGEACRLLVYARGFYLHTIDIGFDVIVRSSLASFQASGGILPFESTYVLDEHPSAYVEI
jgi:hypothetical protein